MNQLSKQQQDCLDAIHQLWNSGIPAPTYQQVGDIINRTRERVRQHANRLRELGYLDTNTHNLVAPGGKDRMQHKIDAAYRWLVANHVEGATPPRAVDLPPHVRNYLSDLLLEKRIHDSYWIVPTCFSEYTTAHDFWKSVDKSAGPCGCWPYLGSAPNGYGHVSAKYLEDSKGYAHRAAFLYSGGILTDEKPWVLHMCDNPICCNPAHLYAGSPTDNARDRDMRKRTKSHHMPPELVLHIKAQLDKGVPRKEIAKETGYCYMTIYNIERGKSHRKVVNTNLELN